MEIHYDKIITILAPTNGEERTSILAKKIEKAAQADEPVGWEGGEGKGGCKKKPC